MVRQTQKQRKENTSLSHRGTIRTFKHGLVVLADGSHKNDSCDVIEAVNPLSSLRLLSAHIIHLKVVVANQEIRLDNAGSAHTSPKHVIIVWNIVCGGQGVDA